MDNTTKSDLLAKARIFFEEHIAKNHIKNTVKLSKIKKFNINPFTYKYLSNFLTGGENSVDIAKALIYPRVLGTSFNTTFGTNIQNHFCIEVLGGTGSTTGGIDLEFIDLVDNRKKYCQLKAGPNTINKDDVEPIKQKFRDISNLARTNNLPLSPGDLVLGIVYGKSSELSGHYKKIAKDYNIYIGQEFWKRYTGDDNFYFDLIDTFAHVAIETDGTDTLDKVISELAQDIEKNLNQDYWK